MRQLVGKFLLPVISTIFVAAFLVACNNMTAFYPGSTAADWSFVQSVGGMRLGDPYIKDGHYYVPVVIDVSGNQSITTVPTAINTGLVCASMIGEGSGDIFGMDYWITIYIQPETEAKSPKPGSVCPDVVLGRVGAGIAPPNWNVYFDDRPNSQRGSKDHLIGTVKF